MTYCFTRQQTFIDISTFKTRSKTQNIIFVSHRVENIVRKGENADKQHFLLFPQHLQKTFPYGHKKN